MRMERKYVRRRRALVVIAFIAFIAISNDATTPKQCKVPVSHMSQFCKDLLYP